MLFFFVFPLIITLLLVIVEPFSGVVMVIDSAVTTGVAPDPSSIRIFIDPPTSSSASVTVSSWFPTRLNITPLLILRIPLSLSLNCIAFPCAGIVAPKSVSLWKNIDPR